MKNKYCELCGRKLVKKIKRADKVVEFGNYFGVTHFKRYNQVTGKEQKAIYYVCPRFINFFGFHRRFL